MNCFVSDGNIYDLRGNVIQPDETGIVVLEVDNKPRRFIKNKLINWLTLNNKLIPPPKIKEPIKANQKRQRPSKYIIRNKRKIRTDFTRKGIEIVAMKDGVKHGPFISISDCAKAIKVSKGQISKILKGSTTKTGFTFIKK